jgi:hypothetical protein
MWPPQYRVRGTSYTARAAALPGAGIGSGTSAWLSVRVPSMPSGSSTAGSASR